jgi:Uma2 family endonuclease
MGDRGIRMADVVLDHERTTIPGWVGDLKSFVTWAASPEFPPVGRYSFICGQIRVDLSPEQLFVHNRLKLRITTSLDTLVSSLGLGYVFTDRARLRNKAAALSVEPDVSFVSFSSRASGRAAFRECGESGYDLIDGSPELVVEVVSDSSVAKDTVDLRLAYYEAGIREYWLVDGRGDRVSFNLLRRGSKKFVETEPQAGGWLKSVVLGHSFRITQLIDRLGNPQYTLELRA